MIRRNWSIYNSLSAAQICPWSFHTLQNKVVRVYDFMFGFCIPNSVNTWEAIYDVPEYSDYELHDYVSRR